MLNTNFFHTELPSRPKGKYAHIVMLRVTEGYAVFQTDSELNKSRVAAGAADHTPMTRIALFKRKQTTPERLNGREMLRRYGILADISDILPDGTEHPQTDKELETLAKEHNAKRSGPPFACFYNVFSCGRCPDCITYGFAVGESGSEKSKVLADTAFSLTDYTVSHETFTLNAPYEDGTMSTRGGEVTSRISQQDHVKPQTIFPSVFTTRDLTASLFGYVLQNVLRTARYGATTTRGGTVRNHIVGIVLSDGEIFSNLLFTQRLHDILKPAGIDPVSVENALDEAQKLIPTLLSEDNVRDQQVLKGEDLAAFLQEVRNMDENAVRDMLTQAWNDCEAYFKAFIEEKKDERPRRSKK